jgi:heme exporter protein A
VALARLLLSEARLWCLDEPAAGLDSEAKSRLTGLMAGHMAGGGLILVSSHEELGLDGALSLELGGGA